MNKKNLNIGDTVKVKNGIMCPDLEGLIIEGWQGKITEKSKDENEKDLICIKWDNTTIENMPKYFIDQSEEEGLDYQLMYLFIDDVDLVAMQI